MARTPFHFSSVGWAVVVIAALTLTFSVGLFQPVQRLLVRALAPVGRVMHTFATRIDGTLADRRTAAATAKENESLRSQMVALELERAGLNQQLVELKLLREEQDFLARRSLTGVPTRVIGRSQVNAQRLLVDVGSQAGVQSGAPALAAGGVLVGVVEDVEDSTSSIRLLTADSTNVAVRVRDQSGPPGVIVGERGVGMRLTLVPQNEKLETNLAVITADANPRIPSGILVGKVSTIDVAPGALFQSAAVLPAVPYDRLSVLTILTGR